MIKVMIERHLKKDTSINHLLRDLRAVAMKQPGYVTGETLVSTQDESLVLVVGTWQSFDDWKAWEMSDPRAELDEVIEPLLVGNPEVRTFHVMATESSTVN